MNFLLWQELYLLTILLDISLLFSTLPSHLSVAAFKTAWHNKQKIINYDEPATSKKKRNALKYYVPTTKNAATTNNPSGLVFGSENSDKEQWRN